MATTKWNQSNIPDQSGKTIIITGATSGLGKEATKVLATKNAEIILAVRNTAKAEQVVKELKESNSSLNLTVRELDLSNLASVAAFANGIKNDFDKIDTLINNAGVMMCPYATTEDNFEIQMGVNHLGHFALTGHLLPLLTQSNESRIVVTASVAHKSGDINFDDLNWENRKYRTTKAYSDSKLANLYFAFELKRLLTNKKDAPTITAAHPGWTKTELDRHSGVAAFIGNIVAQKVEKGTLPTLRAATDLTANSGDYFGPNGFLEMRGFPVKVNPNKLSQNEDKAGKLWEQSEALTGVKYTF